MAPHQRKEHIIDVQTASRVGGSIIFPVLLAYFLPYFLIWKASLSTHFFVHGYLDILPPVLYPMVAILTIVLGIILHELLHGVPWAIFATKGWASIRFGLLRPHYIPYCHCGEPLSVKHYIIGALTPLVVLGIAPTIYAWISGNWFFLLFGVFFTVSAIGDVMIVYSMRRIKSGVRIMDHPTEVGYIIYTS